MAENFLILVAIFRALALFRWIELRSNFSEVENSIIFSSVCKRQIEPNKCSSAADLQLKMVLKG